MAGVMVIFPDSFHKLREVLHNEHPDLWAKVGGLMGAGMRDDIVMVQFLESLCQELDMPFGLIYNLPMDTSCDYLIQKLKQRPSPSRNDVAAAGIWHVWKQ